MKLIIKIKPKISYYISILVASVILFYFAYKGVVAYLIHRELYGGGLDTLVLLRASISGIMLLLILLLKKHGFGTSRALEPPQLISIKNCIERSIDFKLPEL